MKIEGVCISADYGDFLAETLPRNRNLFDRLVVVTAPEDRETQRVCEYEYVECIQTDALRSRWGQFAKGSGINVGLEVLDLDGWVVHFDADIVLPPLFRRILQDLDLDEQTIYGVDRHMIASAEQWREHCSNPKLQQEDDIYVHVNQYPLGTRIASSTKGGWLPIGYWQMWNPKGSGVYEYPENHSSAGRTDMQFATQWPRSKRQLLPEILVYHLESEPADQGANWNGRVTKKFGTDAPKARVALHKPEAQQPYRPPKNTIAPTVTDTTHRIRSWRVGDTLTGHVGRWTGERPITYAYQWQRLLGTAWKPIAGATGEHYKLVTQDAAHSIRLQVTGHNARGNVPAHSAAHAVKP